MSGAWWDAANIRSRGWGGRRLDLSTFGTYFHHPLDLGLPDAVLWGAIEDLRTTIGMSSNLRSWHRRARTRIASVLFGILLPFFFVVAVAASSLEPPRETTGAGAPVLDIQQTADDDTPCDKSHAASDGTCAAVVTCIVCTVLPQGATVLPLPASFRLHPSSPSDWAQARIYPVLPPPKLLPG